MAEANLLHPPSAGHEMTVLVDLRGTPAFAMVVATLSGKNRAAD